MERPGGRLVMPRPKHSVFMARCSPYEVMPAQRVVVAVECAVRKQFKSLEKGQVFSSHDSISWRPRGLLYTTSGPLESLRGAAIAARDGEPEHQTARWPSERVWRSGPRPPSSARAPRTRRRRPVGDHARAGRAAGTAHWTRMLEVEGGMAPVADGRHPRASPRLDRPLHAPGQLHVASAPPYAALGGTHVGSAAAAW